jgi:hypothetical protein
VAVLVDAVVVGKKAAVSVANFARRILEKVHLVPY